MVDQDWLRAGHTDPEDVGRLYDQWARTYDRDLRDWSYRAPGLVVGRLADVQAGAAPVLDVGCGTGLVGRALQAAGFAEVVGIDLSARSLELAEATGAYQELHQVDLGSGPIPTDADTFAALVCVGVMTYLSDTEPTLLEMARVVQPGGAILFTQREDLWEERGCQEVIDGLVDAGTCASAEVSEPLPYLPDSEMGDIPARLVLLRSGPAS